jgi:hypothetical protein
MRTRLSPRPRRATVNRGPGEHHDKRWDRIRRMGRARPRVRRARLLQRANADKTRSGKEDGTHVRAMERSSGQRD